MVTATLTSELKDAISMQQAVDFFPGRPHPATLQRWATHGAGSVILKTWRVGKRRMTTLPAIEEFLQAMNAGQ